MLDDKYATLAQEEIDSVKEMYEKKMDLIRDMYDFNDYGDIPEEEETEMTDEEYEKAIAKDREALRDIVSPSSLDRNGHTKTTVAYNEMAKEKMRGTLGIVPPSHPISRRPFESEKDDAVGEVTDAAGYTESDHMDNSTERDLTGIDRTMPYPISDREYCEEFDHHDKVSLYFYKYDHVVCNENEELLDDIENTIGIDAIDLCIRNRVTWIRNEPLAIDYEICSVNGSYAETVVGQRQPPEPPAKALSPREKYRRDQEKKWKEETEE